MGVREEKGERKKRKEEEEKEGKGGRRNKWIGMEQNRDGVERNGIGWKI